MRILFIFCAGMLFAQNQPLTQLASWGQEPYTTSLIAGDYLYVGGNDYSVHAYDIATGAPQPEGCANFLEAIPTTESPQFMGLAQSGDILIGVGGDKVFLFDISVPAQPVAQTVVTWPDFIGGFQHVGDRLFVACPSGLYGLDFANPTTPLSLISWAGDVVGTAANEHYFVVIRSMTADIYDISNPNVPALLGVFDGNIFLSHPFLGPAYLHGTQLYATDGAGVALVLDLSDPTLPSLQSGNDEMGFINGFHPSGNELYAATTQGFYRLDTDTENLIGWHERYLPFNGIAASVSGDHAYVMLGQNKGMVALNLQTSALQNYARQAFSGPARAVATNGGTVFVGLGHSISVTDITNPLNSNRLGALQLNGIVEGLDLNGTSLIATHGKELSVIDVTDPLSLKLVGNLFLGNAYRFERDGDTVYVTGSDNLLRIVDVSEPTQPQWVSSLTLPFPGNDVSISGDRMFVVGVGGGALYDISDSDAPTLMSEVFRTQSFSHCTLVGDYGYTENIGIFYIFNFTDPANPGVTTSGTGNDITAMENNGTHLYVGREGRFYIYELSNPLEPTRTDFYFSDGNTSFDTFVNRVALMSHSLTILDTSDPEDIRSLGSQGVIRTGPIAASGTVHCMIEAFRGFWVGERFDDAFIERSDVNTDDYVGLATSGDTLYASHDNGIDIFDISDPSNPTQTSSISLASQVSLGLLGQIQVDGNRLYFQVGDRLFTYDITNPLILQQIASPTIANLEPFHVVDNLLYTGGGKIYDMTVPNTPALLGEIQLDNTTVGLGVCSDHLFISDGGSLLIFDVSEPSNPCLVRDDRDLVLSTFACGTDFMFMSQAEEGIYAMDLTNFSNTFALHSGDFKHSSAYLAISGNYLHASDANSVIIDISELTTPIYNGHQDKPNNPWPARDGSHLWLADATGIWLLDMSDPGNPQQITHFDLPGTEQTIAIDGQHGYVGTSEKGVYALDLTDPLNPVILDQFAQNVSGGSPSLVADGALHIVNGNTIYAIDVSDPNTLSILNTMQTQAEINDLVLGNGALYLVQPTDSVDIVEPVTLSAVHTMNFSFHNYNIATSGTYAWISKTNDGLDLYDITDPSNPVLLDNWGGALSKLAHDGNTLYILDPTPTIQEWDVTNPLIPDPLNALDIQTYGKLTAFGSSVVMSQEAPSLYVYASCLGRSALNVLLSDWPGTGILPLVEVTNQVCD